MMMNLMLLISLYMLVYYGVVLYTLLKFKKNACRCKKMEAFKQTWNYYYAFAFSTLSFIGLFASFVSFLMRNGQRGGFGQCNRMSTMIAILILQLPAYLNDYAILSLLNRMTNEKCPCTVNWRKITYNMTIVRIVLSLFVANMKCGELRSAIKRTVSMKLKKRR